MAVLTRIDDDDVRALAASYDLGAPLRVQGIPAGSVNSNFALDLTGGRFFLRLYEERDGRGAERETALVERLSHAGVPTPAPLRRLDGGLVSFMRGKPAALFPWRPGGWRCQASVTPADATRVGEALARVHRAGVGEVAEPGRFGFEGLMGRLDAIEASGDARFAPLVPGLRGSLERVQAARVQGMPSGLVHGDLFRDNVLWDERGEISALLDFESAGAGTYAYDLMVTVLSWCFGDDLDPRLASAMRAGYERVRPLGSEERQGLWAEGSFAALRFLLTRITDYAMRRDAAGPRVVKDWRRFEQRFARLQELGSAGLARVLEGGAVRGPTE